MTGRTAASLLALVLVVPASAESQPIVGPTREGRPPELTLARALEIARERNRSLLSADARTSEQEASLRAARAQRWPSLDVGQRVTRLDPSTVARANAAADGLSQLLGVEIPPFVFRDSYLTRVDLTVPLWTSGGLSSEIAAERGALDARRAGREAVWRATQTAVVRRFFALAGAGEVAVERRKALERAERRLQEARHRLEVGLAARQEVLRWEVEVESARASLATVEADAMVARMELADELDLEFAALGDPVVAERPAADALLTWADSLEPADVLERAERELDDLPEVRAARAEAEASGHAVRGARSALMPRLDAAAAYGWLENQTLEPDEFQTWSATLQLAVPIDLGGRLRARVAEARAVESQARTAVDDARAAARLAVGRALAAVLRSRSLLHSARRAVEEATARRELLARQTEVGLTSLLDLIDADTTLVAAEVARATARLDLLAAVAELEIAWPGAEPPAGGLIP